MTDDAYQTFRIPGVVVTYDGTVLLIGQFLENVGLHEEPYFKYFNYSDFVTPYSGLIQIRRYAEINGSSDLTEKSEIIKDLSKQVKERIYHLLVHEFKYFE